MSEKNLLDKMSLIDMDYVEAAEYPKVHKFQRVRNTKWLKVAVAAAAIFCISIVSICFRSQTTAIAENLFFEDIVLFDECEIKEKMDIVEINRVPNAAWDKRYDTLEEVEDLLGITLLKSTKVYDPPAPSVLMERYWGGEMICISDSVYYMHNEMVLSMGDDYAYYRKLGDGAYRVSYTATFFSEFNSQNRIEGDYTQTVFVKNYTTAHGLEAAIYYWNGQFHALIYHDNIRYEIDMDVWDQRSVYLQRGDETQLLEEYLDTLS